VSRGEFYVCYGSDSFYDRNLTDANITMWGIDEIDSAGTSLATGDINSDSVTDVIIGAYYSGGYGNDGSGVGEIYVVYGGDSIGNTNLSNANVTFWGIDNEDFTGNSLAAGDVNNDSVTDIIISAYYGNGFGNIGDNRGEIFIIYNCTYNYNLTDANLTLYGGTNIYYYSWY
jgi:hypothetical protein